jgi:hypothetical protein
METATQSSTNVNAAAAGVVLSLGGLVALVYQGLTDAGYAPMRISIPVMLSMAALCTGVVLLIAAALTRPRL